MDTRCNDSQSGELNKTDDVMKESALSVRSESPVFKCVNNYKQIRASRLDSSDYDISNYQINQSTKNRTSSKCGSETNDLVFLSSPVFSPIPPPYQQFQPSSICSLETITKKYNSGNSARQNLLHKSQIQPNEEIKCNSCAFDTLGMTDKDISWVSSMATPAPHLAPGSKFNTIEKATFFPEEKFENIQPRALFSPVSDEDSGCKPLSFSSESEDDDCYKTIVRLSDVCATFGQLEVKSCDKICEMGDTTENNFDINNSISPVLKLTEPIPENLNQDEKNIFTESPKALEPLTTYEFSLEKNFESEDLCEKIRSTEKSNSINQTLNFTEDDAFQSISFTYIDELCKTLGNNTTGQSETIIKSSLEMSDNNTEHLETLLNSKQELLISNSANCNSKSNNSFPKQFYITKSNNNIYKISSTNKLNSYAEALVKADVDVIKNSKIDISVATKGIVKLYSFEKEISRIDGIKRLHSQLSEEKLKFSGKKFKKNNNNESSDSDTMSKYLSESQLNVSDSEIFNMVEKLERKISLEENNLKISEDKEKIKNAVSNTVIDGLKKYQEDGDLFETVPNLQDEIKSCSDSDRCYSNRKANLKEKSSFHNEIANVNENCLFNKTCCGKTKDFENEFNIPIESSCVAFKTASGNKISVSEVNLMKANEILQKCAENYEWINHNATLKSKNAFLSDPRKKIKVSTEALEKAKTLLSECEQKTTKTSFEKINSKSVNEFVTGLRKKIQISTKALERAKALLAETNESVTETNIQRNDSKLTRRFVRGSCKRIQVSTEALEKAKKLFEEPNEQRKAETESGEIFPDSLKTLPKRKMNQTFEPETLGFSTASGLTVSVLEKSLQNAKKMMVQCYEDKNESDETLNSPIDVSKNVFDGISKSTPKRGEKSLKILESNVFDSSSPKGISVGFRTGLGHKVQISKESLEKAKILWTGCNEEDEENFQSLEDNRVNEFNDSVTEKTKKIPVSFSFGFSTASGSEVTVSAFALAKARESMALCDENSNTDVNITNQESIINSKLYNVKDLSENPSEKKRDNTQTPDFCPEGNDWNEIIPEWLHVYNTSPSMVSDCTELSPIISNEKGKSSNFENEYIIRNPVLGSNDRFFKKIKRRKLEFEECENKSESKFPFSNFFYKDNVKKTSLKRNCSNLPVDFSVPFKKFKFTETNVDSEELSIDVKRRRDEAVSKQEKEAKERQKIKPVKGSHLSSKCSNKQLKWKEAVSGLSPEAYSDEYLRKIGIKEDIISINITNAIHFKFSLEDFNQSSTTDGILVGDDCLVIPDNRNKIGLKEIERGFKVSPGVRPEIIPLGWVANHYKWIVWKLAHYEKSFPKFFGGKCLSLNNVMLQLKYRYDREIDRNERPALRKILERDDTSIKRMVLCVCGIEQLINTDKSVSYELNLTDGWYSCPARTDPAFNKIIEEGRVTIGTKLMIHGAVLVNCEQGVPPLELGEDVYLKIFTNSTRRAKWDAKLGFQKNPGSLVISINSILPQGGYISRLDVTVVRVYPILYMEKTSDGHHVTRNRRSEERAELEFRKIQEKKMEIICSQIQGEMHRSMRDKPKEKDFSDLEEAEELCHLMESCSDPSALQERLSTDQRKLVENFQFSRSDRMRREFLQKINEKLEKEKLIKRNVTEFLKVKVVDNRKPDYNNPAAVSVWNPNEEIIDLFSEGKVISLSTVAVSSSFSRNMNPVQINTTRQTQYRYLGNSSKYPARRVTPFSEVASHKVPLFEEVDLVGLVVYIRDISYGSRLSQVVYLTDLENNFVGIVFWGSCKDYCWETILKVRSVVACINLQWKRNCIDQEVPLLHVSESSIFTGNPKFLHLKNEMEKFEGKVPKDVNALCLKYEEELMIKLEEESKVASTSRHYSSTGEIKSSKFRPLNGFSSKPAASSTPIKPFSKRVNRKEEVEPSPIQKRLEKLQSYGEPPPLIPLIVSNNSRKYRSRKPT